MTDLLLGPGLTADVLINLMAGVGVFIVARANRRVDPRGALTKRIVFALGLVSALFFLRAAGWLTDSPFLLRASSALSGFTPLAGLFVVEGLLRRHAPFGVKAALSGGAVLATIVALANPLPAFYGGLVLLTLVFGGFAVLVYLLLARDSTSLSRAENRTIQRLLVAAVFLLPLIPTDFRSVFPMVPVRLGALGVLILLYLSFSASGLSAPGAARLLSLLGFLAIAVLFALGFAATEGRVDVVPQFAVAAVGISGLILAGLISEELGARGERARPPSALLAATSVAAFEEALRSDPILQDAKILTGADLADVADSTLDSLLEQHGVLRRRDAPWGRSAREGGVERALSLLLSFEATHLLRLGRAPLRLVACAVAPIASDPRTEMEILLAQRLGEALYAGEAARAPKAPKDAQSL